MHETLIGRDFEHWVALSDAYAKQISQLGCGGPASPNSELLRLAHDLQIMNSDLRPPSTTYNGPRASHGVPVPGEQSQALAQDCGRSGPNAEPHRHWSLAFPVKYRRIVQEIDQCFR
jgi:hypothetical protein